MKGQKIIILNGPMAGGKTSVSQLLFKKMKRTVLLGNDHLKCFVSDYQRTKPGIPGDRKTLSEGTFALYKIFIDKDFSIILDNFFIEKSELRIFENYARKKKKDLYLFQIEAPTNVLLDRVRRRSDKMSPKINLEKISWYKKTKREDIMTFDSSILSAEQITKAILNNI